MAKFKRFDPNNRKASTNKFKQGRYYDSSAATKDNDYIKRKTEYEEWIRIHGDDVSDDEDKAFQPQRTGVRL
jgi:hypothetical protein